MRNSSFIVILSVILLVGCDSRHVGLTKARVPARENAATTSDFTPHGLDIYLPGVYSVAWSAKEPNGGKKEVEGKAVIKRILGGKFVEIDLEASGDILANSAKTFIKYNADSGTYYAWFFRDNGVTIQVESRPSNREPRTMISEGFMGGLKYKGSTTWSNDYREIVEIYRWYDSADRLVRTDVGRLRLLEAQPVAPPDRR